MFGCFALAVSRRLWWVCSWVALAAVNPSCGKRGDPLPPLRRHPAAVEELRLTQRGAFLELEWKAPMRTRDGSGEVELKSAEVFRRVLEPEPAAQQEKAPAASEKPASEGQSPPAPSEPPEPPAPTAERRPFAEEAALVATLPSAAPGQALTYRDALEPSWTGKLVEYAVRHVNRKGRKGGFSPLARIHALSPLEPPERVKVLVDGGGLHLTWVALMDAVGDPRYRLGFNVYRRKATEPYPPRPLQGAPLLESRVDDQSFTFGQRWCYVVRAVAVPVPRQEETEPEETAAAGPGSAPTGEGLVESLDSEEICLTPEDTFPPPTPKGLIAVKVAQGILLSWEDVEADDLGGYRVYRATRPGGPFDLLTAEPLPVASFTDRELPNKGVFYYAVSAVDRAQPPNESPRTQPLTGSSPR